MRSVECSIDSRFPSAQTILRCLGVDAGMFQCRTPGSSASIDCPPGCVHPFETAVDEGLFLLRFARRLPIG